jgi:hypothetical protein
MTTESYTTSFHSEDEVSGGTEVRFTHRRLIPLTEWPLAGRTALATGRLVESAG